MLCAWNDCSRRYMYMRVSSGKQVYIYIERAKKEKWSTSSGRDSEAKQRRGDHEIMINLDGVEEALGWKHAELDKLCCVAHVSDLQKHRNRKQRELHVQVQVKDTRADFSRTLLSMRSTGCLRVRNRNSPHSF